MRKTNKEKYLEAALNIATEYEHGGHIRLSRYCSYCKITFKTKKNECIGCPMSKPSGMPGCVVMKTYTMPTREEVEKPFKSEVRAKFHREAYKIMENIDKKYFTKKGWQAQAFQPLWDLDNKLTTLYK